MNTNLITERIPMGKRQPMFSPVVRVLAGTLVPVVSTNTWWFRG